MLIRKRVHAGQVYLGRDVMRVLGIRDGDEVELEVRDGEVVLRPVRRIDRIDKDTIDLVRMLKEVEAYGGYEDYFEEYNYEDVGG